MTAGGWNDSSVADRHEELFSGNDEPSTATDNVISGNVRTSQEGQAQVTDQTFETRMHHTTADISDQMNERNSKSGYLYIPGETSTQFRDTSKETSTQIKDTSKETSTQINEHNSDTHTSKESSAKTSNSQKQNSNAIQVYTTQKSPAETNQQSSNAHKAEETSTESRKHKSIADIINGKLGTFRATHGELIPISMQNPEVEMTYGILRLTSENLWGCFARNGFLKFIASEGVVTLDTGEESWKQAQTNSTCTIVVTIPPNQMMGVSLTRLHATDCIMKQRMPVEVNFIGEDSGYSFFNMLLFTGCQSPKVMRYSGFTRIVKIELRIAHVTGPYNISFSFISVPEAFHPALETVFTSSTTGYIQTLQYDGVSFYPNLLDSEIRLEAPADHSIMISMDSMHVESGMYWTVGVNEHMLKCHEYEVELTTGQRAPSATTTGSLKSSSDDDGRRTIARFCSILPNRITARIDGDLLVTFRTVEKRQTGFRLAFSFHNRWATPQQLIDGRWNCSVPYWPDFQYHLACNLMNECVGGEDEAECPYTTTLCGEGRITVGYRCYGYRVSREKKTWADFSSLCLGEGGYLASINTAQEWMDILHVLRKYAKHSYKFSIGLKSPSADMTSTVYHKQWDWSDGSVAYFPNTKYSWENGWYGYIERNTGNGWYMSVRVVCDALFRREADCLCEFNPVLNPLAGNYTMKGTDGSMHKTVELKDGNKNWHRMKKNGLEIVLAVPRANLSRSCFTRCRDNHTAHSFLACDPKTACWARDELERVACPANLVPLPPAFACYNGFESVPYRFVCDFIPHCSDNSDETSCVFPPCPSELDNCNQRQCAFFEHECSFRDLRDKRYSCSAHPLVMDPTYRDTYALPYSRLRFIDKRHFGFDNVDNATTCPETHFSCARDDFYCLPVFLRCNGHNDCPDHEDEADCDSYMCPGYYRCRASRICIHEENLCDKLFHCPQHDDELECDRGCQCPANCTCYGPAFFCTDDVTPSLPADIRFLNATGSGISLRVLTNFTMLFYLSLAKCGLTQLDHMNFPNLHELDLSDNRLTLVYGDHLRILSNLRVLVLSGNPLTHPYITPADTPFLFVTYLDLSRVSMPILNFSILAHFPNLLAINLSHTGVDLVTDEGFRTLTKLRVLDLRGSPITHFPAVMFRGLDLLETVYADNYRICCPVLFSDVAHVRNCHAPSDKISSCDALLRSSIYRFLLSVFAVLALTGNLATFLFRGVFCKNIRNTGYAVFVTHLCVSDFLMGVYLAVIGLADRIYYGTYVYNDMSWKSSVVCKAAGFLSLLSVETSAFFIFLITLDRFVVLRFPLGQVRFRKQSAHWACVVAWLVGLCLSALPFLPMLSHLDYYGNTGICVPLPITSKKTFSGYPFSFGVMVVLNFVLFLLIAAGQIFVYLSVRANSMSVTMTNSTSKEVLIARRLISVAASNFLCWFPVGLLGVLASQGKPIPAEVNVALAVIALPINAAFNPFLYTINLVLERRRQRNEESLRKYYQTEIERERRKTATQYTS